MPEWDDLCQILFELSNESRLHLALSLFEEKSTVTQLAKKYELSTQETSRHLTRLTENGLIHRDTEGAYEISQFGRLFLSTLGSQWFIAKNRDYFSIHDASHIPEEYQSRLGELEKSIYVDDVMAVFQRIQEMIDDAEEYIYRLTDRRFNLAYPHLQEAAERGVDFRLIETLEYEVIPDVNQFQRVFPSETRGLPVIPVFIAMSEKEVAALAFPTEGRFDYRGFTSRDERAIKWCRELFQYYWEQAKPKL
jgi:predicted transcriptional regulator